MRASLVAILAGAGVLTGIAGAAQRQLPGRELGAFVDANERFGRTLLAQVHRAAPERNLAVSPLPVSIAFAALEGVTVDSDSSGEIRRAFAWEDNAVIQIAARTLLGRFANPGPRPPRHRLPNEPPDSAITRMVQRETPEELWMSSTFLYRRSGGLTLPRDFIARVQYASGLPFEAVEPGANEAVVFSRLGLPKDLASRVAIRDRDFWMASNTHLRTAWAGNTFILSKPKPGRFQKADGGKEEIPFLTSEFNAYRHRETPTFEAVALPCLSAYLVMAMPASGRDILELEQELRDNPEALDAALKEQLGDVTLPPFDFTAESDLRAALGLMGVHRIFKELHTLYATEEPYAGAALTGVAQKVHFALDKEGIRSDSGTIVTGVYGGILGVQNPFHMVVDRPFVFLIRDNVTNALLFAGVVTDPAQH